MRTIDADAFIKELRELANHRDGPMRRFILQLIDRVNELAKENENGKAK